MPRPRSTPKPTRPTFKPPSTSPLDANALELFARIVAAGSFAAAARELGQTRAAVSRRVAVIEAALGQPLFARSTRALGLTEAGRRLSVRARDVADATAAARASFRAKGEQDSAEAGFSGTLRVTAVPSFGTLVLAPLLAAFQAPHPGLKLELSVTHRRIDLLREDVDVAFRITHRPPEDWVARPVLKFEIHGYAAPRRGLPLKSPILLASERSLVMGTPVIAPLQLHWQHRRGDKLNVEIVPACASDDLAALMALARGGAGIVYAPDFSVREELASGALIDVLPGWQLHVNEGDTVHALTLPQPTASAAARALVQFVAQALA